MPSNPNRKPDSEPTVRCWCGVEGTASELFDIGVFQSGPCGGLGVLHCECGGDSLCVCHNHGEVPCEGCEDCREHDTDMDDWDDPG